MLGVGPGSYLPHPRPEGQSPAIPQGSRDLGDMGRGAQQWWEDPQRGKLRHGWGKGGAQPGLGTELGSPVTSLWGRSLEIPQSPPGCYHKAPNDVQHQAQQGSDFRTGVPDCYHYALMCNSKHSGVLLGATLIYLIRCSSKHSGVPT